VPASHFCACKHVRDSPSAQRPLHRGQWMVKSAKREQCGPCMAANSPLPSLQPWVHSFPVHLYCMLRRPNNAVCSSMLRAYTRSRKMKEAVAFFDRMGDFGLVPDKYAYTALLWGPAIPGTGVWQRVYSRAWRGQAWSWMGSRTKHSLILLRSMGSGEGHASLGTHAGPSVGSAFAAQ